MATRLKHKYNERKVGLGVGVAGLVPPLRIFPSLKELRVESNMSLDFGTYGLGAQAREQPALGLRTHRARRPAPSAQFRQIGVFFHQASSVGLAQGVCHCLERIRGASLDREPPKHEYNRDGVKRWEVTSVISREGLLPENGGTLLMREFGRRFEGEAMASLFEYIPNLHAYIV